MLCQTNSLQYKRITILSCRPLTVFIKRNMWKQLGKFIKPNLPSSALMKPKLSLSSSLLKSQKKEEIPVATIHNLVSQIENTKKACIPSGVYSYNKPNWSSSIVEDINNASQHKEAIFYQFLSYLNIVYGGDPIRTPNNILDRINKLTHFSSQRLPSYPLNHPHTYKAYFALNQNFLALDLFNRGLPIEYLIQFNDIDFSRYPQNQLIPMTTFLEMFILEEYITQNKKPKDEFVALDPKMHPEFFQKNNVLFNTINKQDHPDALRIIYLPDGTRKEISLDVKLIGHPSLHLPAWCSFVSLEPFYNLTAFNIRLIGDLFLKIKLNKNNPLFTESLALIKNWSSNLLTQKQLLDKHKINKEIFNEKCEIIKNEMLLHPINLYLFPSTILNAEISNSFFQLYQENEQEFARIFKEIAPLMEKDIIFPTYTMFDPISFKKFTLSVIEKLPPHLRIVYKENFYKIRELFDLIEDV